MSSQKVNTQAYTVCKPQYRTGYYDECINAFKKGYDIGQQEHSMCISSVPQQVVSLPTNLYSSIFGSTQVEKKRPVFRLPLDDDDDINPQSECNRKFDIIDTSKLNWVVASLIPTGKSLQEYFNRLNATIHGTILDFSKINLQGYKLSTFGLERLQEVLAKISDFQRCDLLKPVKTFVLYGQDFTVKHIPLIPFVFEKFADRKSTRLNSSHVKRSRMPSSA